jgi:hypothetical protein
LLFALNGWARQNLSDGYVPNYAVAALAPLVKASRKHDLPELLRVGLLTEATDGVQIADYMTWQETREEVEARREKARRMADARWHASGNAPSNAEGNATYRKETKSKEDLSLVPNTGLSDEQRDDLNYLAATLDAEHRWQTADLHAKLAELGPDGLLRALADAHLEQEGILCGHFGDGSQGQVVVKRPR